MVKALKFNLKLFKFTILSNVSVIILVPLTPEPLIDKLILRVSKLTNLTKQLDKNLIFIKFIGGYISIFNILIFVNEEIESNKEG
jgi:hypothetical protein